MKTFYKAAVAVSVLTSSMAIAMPANALTFKFSYTFNSGSILSGELEGDLLEDANTVLVSKLLSSSYTDTNGSQVSGEQESASAIETIYEISPDFLGSPFGQGAFVTFDGTKMDFSVCSSIQSLVETEVCEEGFYITSVPQMNFGEILYGIVGENATTKKDKDSPFNVAEWLLVEQSPDISDSVTDVPTPAAILPVLTGLFGAASKRKQKKEA